MSNETVKITKIYEPIEITDEMRKIANEMQEAISTEYKRRVLEDERKLEAVLRANGWRKASDVALEVIDEIEKIIDKHYNKNCFKSDLDDIEIDAIINFSDDISHDLAELKKKYTEDGEWNIKNDLRKSNRHY